MVKGPAKVAVNGVCHILGTDVSGKTVRVRAGKALPFELSNRCRLHARLGYGGRLWWAHPDYAGTSMWHNLAHQVLSALAAGKKQITVMLVGATDTGKSTLTIYLANMAIRRGIIPCVIDGDIGQGDLAPPTAIGAAVLSKQVLDLRDVGTSSSMYEFVGSITPAGFEGLIAKELRSISDRISPLANITIVNTDGYVSNGGVQYKAIIAKELQPDAVILLGENDDSLFDTLKSGPWQVMRARPSNQTYKSRFERLSRRLDQFLRYVGNESYTAELSQINAVYMGNLFSPSELLFQTPSIMQLKQESMKRMFVGLGSKGKVVGFGIIINVTPGNRGIIHVQTDINSFDTIYLSNIRLSSTNDTIIEENKLT
jgi:polynucleotide 5'-hydroxyl-kinase GRC3/NOL9